MAALNRAQQVEAGELYKSGFSAQQIANHFGVSLDAAFYALRRQKIVRRSSAASNKIRYQQSPTSFKIKENLSDEEERLKLAAVMLYWAEGYKAGDFSVDFANSDPSMALLFRKFLTKICGITESRLRAYIYCYEGQDSIYLKNFWSSALSVPLDQFSKTYIKPAGKSVRGPRMIYGLVHVRYCDKKLLQQLLIWIEEYKLKCVGGGVVNRKGL